MNKLNVSNQAVLEDFDLFLTFLRNHKQISLTNELAQLKRSDLFRLNEEMHFKAAWVTDKSAQYAYSELNFFFEVVVAARMGKIYYEEKNNYLVPDLNQVERYTLFTPTEQYFFLLETAWCYLDWAKLCDHRSWYFAESILTLLRLTANPAFSLGLEREDRGIRVPDNHHFVHVGLSTPIVQVFEYLGFYNLEPESSLKKKPDCYSFPFKKIIPQPLSAVLTPVLLEQRDLEIWNLPLRKDQLTSEILLGLTEEAFYRQEGQYLVPRPVEELTIPSFLDVFKPLMEADELTESMYPHPQ
jgi:hypothetical protein